MQQEHLWLPLFMVATSSCRPVNDAAAEVALEQERPSVTETTRKTDYEELVGAVRPFAEQCLRRYRQFVPFGATVTLDGEVALVAGWEGSEEPDAVEVMELLLAGYREGARNGQCRATALVYDILTLPPGKAQKQDAIAIALNHRDGEPTALVIPYSFNGDELVVEEPYERKAEIRVFE